MSARKSVELAWRPVACLLCAFSLLGCSDDGGRGSGLYAAGSAPKGGTAAAASGSGGAESVPVAGAASASGGDTAAVGFVGGSSNSGGLASGGATTAGGGGRMSTVDGERPVTHACTGKAGALRGKSNQTLTAGGLTRTFVHYAPSSLSANEPAPVVIAAHGWLQSGQAMYDLSQYQKVADREGFVLMYPDGEPGSVGPWNVGEGACPSSLLVLPTATGDDQAFIDAMVDFADADQCVDRRHVFVTGFSMGGYFTNETGCLRSSIAAIGPHSGGSHELAACPVVHKPVILFHGTSDGLIPVACGTEARDRWVAHNGCSAAIESVAVTGGHCEYSQGCPADGQVALCLFDGMDHGWAGGQGSYGFPNYESASELGWAFFKKYAW
jgi:polyhydroxybutyrate depolymerase